MFTERVDAVLLAAQSGAVVAELGRVAQRREARIDVILDTATQLVVDGGLEALTLQRLAAELGMVTTALYRYFPGKTELMAALQVRAIGALAGDVAAAIAAVDALAGVKPRVRALARAWAAIDVFLDGPVRAPARHRLIDAFLSAPEAQLDARALADVEAVLAPLLATVTACVAEAAAVGALADGDAAVRTRVLWASAHGVQHLRRRDRVEPRARQSAVLAREAIAVAWRGWGATPAAIEAARAVAAKVAPRAPRARR